MEAADTSDGALPVLRIVTIRDEGDSVEAGGTSAVMVPRHISEMIARELGIPQCVDELRIADAHRALQHDVLVTSSSVLLANRQHQRLVNANIRSPAEAVKIIGLYLRYRGDYTWYCDEIVRRKVDRLIFYWVLARERLPAMWRYFSACVAASRFRGDDILDLGGSILTRAQRALEARDAIGVQFYQPQNNYTRAEQAYHFDYLTLLLVGALDAQARVAWRVYGVKKPGERSVNFWRPPFLDALKTEADARQLLSVVLGEEFLALVVLLVGLRNTIHGASLQTLAYERPAAPQASLFSVPASDVASVRKAAERLGGLERWGLTGILGLECEPYTYAVSLVEETFKAIDAIAAATTVDRLLPSGQSIQLLSSPPDKSFFRPRVRARLSLLG